MTDYTEILAKATDLSIAGFYRRDAIKKLADLGESDPQAHQAFLKLPLDEDASVRRAYLKILAKLDEQEAMPKLLEFLQSESDNYVLKNVIEDIRHYRNPQHIEVLTPFLEHSHYSVSSTAKDAIKALELVALEEPVAIENPPIVEQPPASESVTATEEPPIITKSPVAEPPVIVPPTEKISAEPPVITKASHETPSPKAQSSKPVEEKTSPSVASQSPKPKWQRSQTPPPSNKKTGRCLVGCLGIFFILLMIFVSVAFFWVIDSEQKTPHIPKETRQEKEDNLEREREKVRQHLQQKREKEAALLKEQAKQHAEAQKEAQRIKRQLENKLREQAEKKKKNAEAKHRAEKLRQQSLKEQERLRLEKAKLKQGESTAKQRVKAYEEALKEKENKTSLNSKKDYNKNCFVAQWQVKNLSDFTLEIDVETNKGLHYLTYATRHLSKKPIAKQVHIIIDAPLNDSIWRTFRRDLQKDIRKRYRGVKILKIKKTIMHSNSADFRSAKRLYFSDKDGDLIPQDFENKYRRRLRPTRDDDHDGLNNLDEAIAGTNPLEKDTDKDGLLDGFEVQQSGTSPVHKDSDSNGINDGDELGTDDKVSNLDEQKHQTSPTSKSLSKHGYHFDLTTIVSPKKDSLKIWKPTNGGTLKKAKFKGKEYFFFPKTKQFEHKLPKRHFGKKIIQWSFVPEKKFPYLYYTHVISIMTNKGLREIVYVPYLHSQYLSHRSKTKQFITYGTGTLKDGKWTSFRRHLVADLKQAYPKERLDFLYVQGLRFCSNGMHLGSVHLLSYPDRDQDLIPDKLEDSFGSDISAKGDINSDGTTNLTKLIKGQLHKLVADDDSDGISNSDEETIYHSDPKAPDHNGQFKTILEIKANDAVATVGRWQLSGYYAKNKDRSGSLTYDFSIPQAGIYELQLEHGSKLFKNKPIQIDVSIDGRYIASPSAKYIHRNTQLRRVVTPYLKKGHHSLTLFLNNFYSTSSFNLRKIRFGKRLGPDANRNGIADWLDHRLISQNDVDEDKFVSIISPAQISGQGQYVHNMSLSEGKLYTAEQGRWYAEVPLRAGQTKQIDVTWAQGMARAHCKVNWQETNICQQGELSIPLNSSLLLTAHQSGSYAKEISLLSQKYQLTKKVLKHRFTSAGKYNFTASIAGKAYTLRVTVIAPPKIASPWLWQSKTRLWRIPKLTKNMTLTGRGLSLKKKGSAWSLSQKTLQPTNILVRLGEEGPILTTVATQPFTVTYNVDDYITTLQDRNGQAILQSMIYARNLPKGIKLGLEVRSTDTRLENGARKFLLDSDQFDRLQRYPWRVYVGPKNKKRHTSMYMSIHQDDQLVGWGHE